MGAEYHIDAEHVVHFVHRPVRREVFIGYGIFGCADHGLAIMRVSHDGPMTPWRYVSRAYDRTAVPEPTDTTPTGYLNLPGEEHGWTWGDPIDVPSTEPVRYTVTGREIAEAEAQEALDRFHAAAQPESSTGRIGFS